MCNKTKRETNWEKSGYSINAVTNKGYCLSEERECPKWSDILSQKTDL